MGSWAPAPTPNSKLLLSSYWKAILICCVICSNHRVCAKTYCKHISKRRASLTSCSKITQEICISSLESNLFKPSLDWAIIDRSLHLFDYKPLLSSDSSDGCNQCMLCTHFQYFTKSCKTYAFVLLIKS